jgi:hypothetical protein
MTKEKAQQELATLNEAVDAAIKARTEFLDKYMHLFAEFQIGEEVYNCQRKSTDKVVGHYRYQARKNPIYDNSFSVDCEIKVGVGTGDNTSRFAGRHPWVKLSDFQDKTQAYVRKLESLT